MTQSKNRKFQIDWSQVFSAVRTFIFMHLGIGLGIVALQVFMVPFDIAPSGLNGIAVILNELIGTPIGLMYLIGNIPIMALGYRYLGGWRMVILSIYAIVVYSIGYDLVELYIPLEGVSDNVLLNALFGGILSGISLGFIIRIGASFGGASTLALIIQRRTGTPLSTTFLYTDIGIIMAIGVIFGWESALYAVVALFISGVASDYIIEGPSVIRTVFIVTDRPRTVSNAIIEKLGRGVTSWDALGMYTEREHSMLYVTIARTQVEDLRSVVAEVDEYAFVVVGQGHTAYGVGFKRTRPKFTWV